MDVITSHIQADFDAFGSMTAARILYPGAVLVFPGAQERALREYIASEHIDIARIRDINIGDIRRLIVVDTRQVSRIGPFSSVVEKGDADVVIFDHHPSSDDDFHGDHEIVQEMGSNTALMVGRLKETGLVPSPVDATIMAMGIFEDTGFLLFPSTTPDDCRALADLISWGADLDRVARAISREIGPEQIDLLDQMVKNAWTFQVQGIEVLVSFCSTPSYVEDLAMLVHKMRGMYEVDAMFVLSRMGERIYLVARSSVSQLDARAVAAGFGGAGHPTAAAASIRDLCIERNMDTLVRYIRKETMPRITARDIMTFPIKTLSEDASIDEAGEVLNRYNINALCVFSRDTQVAGIISRQVVTRAQGHKLGRERVGDYMVSDLVCVSPDAPVARIRSLIIDSSQRLLPVINETGPIGVITRTDLMMVMHEKMSGMENVGQASTHPKVIDNLLQERLPADLYAQLKKAGVLAESMGYRIYLVGGIVRDMVMRIDNLDVDLVVEGSGIEFALRLASEIGARVATHEKYKTAVITLPNGRHLDVATARVEYYNGPGEFPVVEESTLKLDLYRRDFTINTMAVSLLPDQFGRLIDFFGAIRDIKEKRIRVLHSLSFVEDPSRILRAVRFEKRLGFILGKQTRSMVQSAVKAGFLSRVSGRRISHEMQQIFCEDDPSGPMNRLDHLGILSSIHPDLSFRPATMDLFGRARQTLSWFSLLYTHEDVRTWYVYLLALFDSMRHQKAVSVCSDLGMSPEQTDRILLSKRQVNVILKGFAANPDKGPSWVLKALKAMPMEVILFSMSKTKSPGVREKISSYITTWRYYRTPVTGMDLISIGFVQGSHLGDCLRLIKDKGLDGEIRDFNEAMEFARGFL
ncbi:MAG: CBS domain-containing protein [Thermodesulfobacteriota bacterium]|nr:CBS domain-containing protein [Thermodesulfobacteriota bacterium]